jgi:hypothetical protein
MTASRRKLSQTREAEKHDRPGEHTEDFTLFGLCRPKSPIPTLSEALGRILSSHHLCSGVFELG